MHAVTNNSKSHYIDIQKTHIGVVCSNKSMQWQIASDAGNVNTVAQTRRASPGGPGEPSACEVFPAHSIDKKMIGNPSAQEGTMPPAPPNAGML